ncbi:multisite-specific tRNA:(cytosine-C(5))-methyltransferase trm4b-like [Culex quinquefasciatus]|uniref:multisite-specific tRNA:(cytosine-C(5))-methyltransferase trm4b-like n=1 Tax=Culex quinquefasciatus TaxID=7176 RepID=UPI0018E30B8B|nr:multisite-specific tRNA:(cytosine-C(5))-methyltransferase trm4b-like [Culex quinquefasciatus]
MGGKLVYMTCSLNPNENESVLLAEMVEQCLVPTLKQSPGNRPPRTCKSRKTPAPEDLVKFNRFNLERCNLALLYQQNTGRFFIVLFEKKKKLLSEDFHQKPPSKACEAEPPQKKLKRYHRNPLNLLTRCREDKKKNIYWPRRDDLIKLLFKNDPEKPPEIEGLGEEGVGTVQMCVGVSADPFAVRNYYPPRRRFLTWA